MDEIWTAAEARHAAGGDKALRRAVREGAVIRIRRDNYAAPGVAPDVFEAVRIGGRVGCVSGLRLAGIWVSARGGLHAHVAPDATRLRPAAAVLHWVPPVAGGSRGRVSLLDAILVAMVCQTFIDAVASVDSALHQRLITMAELVPHCTDHARAEILRWVDGRAESGLETIVRIALIRAGLRVEVQVRISGVGRVDLLVEGWVIVETDGAAYHSGPRRHVDHQRDAAATTRGYSSLRFDPAQVTYDLVGLVAAVIAAVRSNRAAHFSGRNARVARDRARRAV